MATEYDAASVQLSAFNARDWSGVAVFDRGGASVTLPTYGTLAAGRFRDALDFLNGRGQSASECLPGALAAAWTGAGTATCGIDSTNRFYIQSTAEDFEIAASANNAIFGFDPAGHAVVGGVAPFRRTAPNPWQLGAWINASITIDPAAGAAFTLGGSRYHQDLVTAIREWSSADADDRNPSNNLQALDGGIYGASVRWLIDATGHVVTSWRTGTMASVTWLSTSFQERLGFSGNETVASSGLVDYLRADSPLPGLLLFADGFEVHEIGVVTTRTSRDMTDGATASISTGTSRRRYIEGYLRGPAMGSSDDMHRHFVGGAERAGWMDYVEGRMWVTAYPCWGDPRRWRDPQAVTTTRLAHDLVHTTGLQGYRGRVECTLAAPPAVQRVSWEGDTRQHWLARFEIKEQT